MNIERLFSDLGYLDKEFQFFTKKKHIWQIGKNPELVQSHIQKARHNLAFYRINKGNNAYNDWLIVTLYYTLYHCALALIAQKSYASKNHYATILILIREYHISRQEISLIDELSIEKEDAQLYSDLRQDRHDASYATELKFDNEKIKYYEERVLEFINKTEEMIENS